MILRAARKFYDIKMEAELNFKKKNVKGQKPKSFMMFTDFFTNKYLDPNLLQLFDHVDLNKISDHLAGLIAHNRLKSEVNEISEPQDLVIGSIPLFPSLENLIPPQVNFQTAYSKRMIEVKEIVALSNDLLIQQYNKVKLEAFTDKPENLILLWDFIQKAQYVLRHTPDTCLQKNEIDFPKRDVKAISKQKTVDLKEHFSVFEQYLAHKMKAHMSSLQYEKGTV